MGSRIELASVPVEVREVIEVLSRAGYRAVMVGGSVRDLLLGRPPKDFDVATSARPTEVMRLFKRVIPTGIDHGTVTVLLGKTHVEVTTFRAEADYADGRRPGKVEFHEDVDADLSRRDFTINAMAYDVAEGLVDPFDGQADLAARLVRCVGDPLARFTEDGLRPLRAVRFATVLGFTLHRETEAAIPRAIHVFRKVALERVNQEFVKILGSPRVAEGLALLRRTGLLDAFLPEADETRFDAAGRAPPLDAVRLAILLGTSKDARRVLLRLKFPTLVAEEAARLIGVGELPVVTASDGDLRRWLQKVELARLDAVLAMARALHGDGAVEPIGARLAGIAAAAPPLTLKALALDGQAIMRALGVGPSPAVGEASRFLLEQVVEDPTRNDAKTLQALLENWRAKPA